MNPYLTGGLVFLLCGALGSAQPRRLPTPAQKAQLLQKNFPLIERLVDHSLKLPRQTDPLLRSEQFRGTFLELQQQLLSALHDGDQARVRELGEHLQSLSVRGLLPSVGAAREQLSQNHPLEARLFEVRDGAERILGELEEAVTQSAIVNSEEVKQLRQTLHAARQELQQRMELKPR